MRALLLLIATVVLASGAQAEDTSLAAELRSQGWIVFSAVGEGGDWDLYAMRPDGSARRRLTDTREFSETGPRISPDGRRLLYHRQPATQPVDNNSYGTHELMLAESTGTRAVSLGTGFPWAAWGPDAQTLAALTPRGIVIVEVASRKIIRTVPRAGIVQQLGWSRDGKSFTGTANGLGEYWNVGVLDAATGKITAVSETDRYNCTPDWMPDARHVVYARGIVPSVGGRAELWQASSDGRERRMLYAEAARHIYGATSSPDGRYFLFTRSEEDLGKVDHAKTTMAVIRAADTPMLGDEVPALRKRFPDAKRALRLDLGPGWEPCWTFHDIHFRP